MSQNHSEDLGNVTRNQGGQFIDEGGTMFVFDPEEAVLNGETDAHLQGTDRAAVNAMQVTMERSGADYIHAQKSFLTNSGAREIASDSAKLTGSGVLTLNAKSAEFKQSSAVIANADTLNLSESRAGIASAGTITTNGSVQAGMINAGTIDATGDVHAFMLAGGDVKAGGSVSSTFTPVTAGAFGAVLAVVLFLLGRIFSKR